MSLIDEQVAFLKDARKLLDFAEQQHYLVTGGELERSYESQALCVRTGRETSMDSPHLRRCAITLNFFRQTPTQGYDLIQDINSLAALGAFWENLDPRNRWGGRHGGNIDAGSFARDPGGWPFSTLTAKAPSEQTQSAEDAPPLADGTRPNAVVLPSSSNRSMTPLLMRGSTETEAISHLQSLLIKIDALAIASGTYDEKTECAVAEFQRNNNLIADGVTGPKTWTTLLALTSSAQQEMANTFLSDDDLITTALQLNIELAALKAVYKVESNCKGFVGNDPKILFEGHIFWQRLKKKGLRPEILAKGNEDILYPTWTKQFYRGGSGEIRRLERAMAIAADAAQESASWGLFQIMGFHWKFLQYDSITDFVERMRRHERDQLEAFSRFITLTKDARGKTLAELLTAKNWAAFAFAYNGSGYRKNAYDDKLRESYYRFLE